jgi:hypothetical protein
MLHFTNIGPADLFWHTDASVSTGLARRLNFGVPTLSRDGLGQGSRNETCTALDRSGGRSITLPGVKRSEYPEK